MPTTTNNEGRQDGSEGSKGSEIAIAKLLNIIIFVNNCHDSFAVGDALKRSARIFLFHFFFLHDFTFWLVPQLLCDMQQIKADF